MSKEAFLFASSFVSKNGYSSEIKWQESVSIDQLCEQVFLREYAWVVLAAGFREAILRRKFPAISNCFFWWGSAEEIANNSQSCVQSAMRVFKHQAKMKAIAQTASLIAREGFLSFKNKLNAAPIATLQGLPYVGNVTKYHLAKNIGIDVAKPDRHLTRIAQLFDYPTAQMFCEEIAREVGTRVAVVDLVFWRFATIHRNYVEILRQFT